MILIMILFSNFYNEVPSNKIHFDVPAL